MDVQTSVCVEVEDRLAEVDAELISRRHLVDYCLVGNLDEQILVNIGQYGVGVVMEGKRKTKIVVL